eukprot:scaffold8826_cov117-Isochrysis_galbana.AAC.1
MGASWMVCCERYAPAAAMRCRSRHGAIRRCCYGEFLVIECLQCGGGAATSWLRHAGLMFDV